MISLLAYLPVEHVSSDDLTSTLSGTLSLNECREIEYEVHKKFDEKTWGWWWGGRGGGLRIS